MVWVEGQHGGEFTYIYIRQFYAEFLLALTLISTAGHLILHPLFIHIFFQSHPFTPALNINIWFRALSPKVLNFRFGVVYFFFAYSFNMTQHF